MRKLLDLPEDAFVPTVGDYAVYFIEGRDGSLMTHQEKIDQGIFYRITIEQVGPSKRPWWKRMLHGER